MDAISRQFYFAVSRQDRAVIGNFEKIAGGHFAPMQTIGNGIERSWSIRHGQGQVVADPFMETMHYCQTMGSSEVDTGLARGVSSLAHDIYFSDVITQYHQLRGLL